MPQITFDGGNASGPQSQSIQLTSNTVTAIFNLVAQQIQDALKVRWPITSKMIPYLNLGIKEIINVKPEAHTLIFIAPLTGGSRQVIPAGALFLVDAESLLDLDNKPVSSVKLVERATMDMLLPGWYNMSAGDTIQYVIKDLRNPQHFHVFPPPPGGTTQSVSLICVSYPVDIESVLQQDGVTPTLFPLDNSYISAIVDYVIYRCLNEETTIPNAQAKAQTSLQSFYKSLGVTMAAKSKSDSQR